MARTASVDSRTYLPEADAEAQIIDFAKALERAGGRAATTTPALIDADGRRTTIPAAMVDVLRQVAESLSHGLAVTVAPMNAMMTTQEAADFLGVSRPTLVRILDRGDLPMERPNRHRYVRLSDLITYQQRLRDERSEALDALARDAEDAGLYAATDGPPPPMR
ncbi:MAG: helix-turn-helix domain-containing protein [Dermatophilaceae bacterium]